MSHARILGIALFSILIFTECLLGEDPGEPDSIIVGCPVLIGCPRPDSIGVPIYIWADETVAGFSIGLKQRSPYLSFSSVSHVGSVLPSNWFWGLWTGTCDTMTLFGAIWYLNGAANPQGLMATVYFQVDPDAPPSFVDVDSCFVPPAGDWVITWVIGLTSYELHPKYRDCGASDIKFAACGYICGDADGSGIVTISDAVFLINYIFSGGPAPDPIEAGDADCSGAVTISDAVTLINYIFSGGPAPCAACP